LLQYVSSYLVVLVQLEKTSNPTEKHRVFYLFPPKYFRITFFCGWQWSCFNKEQDKERKSEAVEDDQSTLSDEELKHEEDFAKEEKQAESQETAQTGKRYEKIEGENILTVNCKTNFENAACVVI